MDYDMDWYSIVDNLWIEYDLVSVRFSKSAPVKTTTWAQTWKRTAIDFNGNWKWLFWFSNHFTLKLAILMKVRIRLNGFMEARARTGTNQLKAKVPSLRNKSRVFWISVH